MLRRNRSIPPSANVTPFTPCMRRVASISRAIFSSSGTVKGSSLMGLRHEPSTGSTADNDTASPGSRAAAFAICTAAAAVWAISPSSRRAVAANPHRPLTRTRTPRPVDSERSIPSISWLRTVMPSVRSVPTRASA